MDMSMLLVLLLHAAATWTMVGIIWFVQIVHYPLFARVGAAQFPAYEGAHSSLTTAVVAAPMLIEASTSVLLVWQRPASISPVLAWSGLALVAACEYRPRSYRFRNTSGSPTGLTSTRTGFSSVPTGYGHYAGAFGVA